VTKIEVLEEPDPGQLPAIYLNGIAPGDRTRAADRTILTNSSLSGS